MGGSYSAIPSYVWYCNNGMHRKIQRFLAHVNSTKTTDGAMAQVILTIASRVPFDAG